MKTETLNALLVVLVILLVYWRIRNLYYNSLALEYQFKLFKLRDKLRHYSIDKKINSKEVFFDYLDTSICVTVKELPNLNIFGIIYLNWKHKGEHLPEQFKKMTNDGMQNEFSKEIFNEYGKIIFEYIKKRHYLIHLFSICIASVFYGVKFIRNAVNDTTKAIEDVRIFPETSASYRMFNLN